MPNLRGKNWSEGDYFKPSDAQFFEDHLFNGSSEEIDQLKEQVNELNDRVTETENVNSEQDRDIRILKEAALGRLYTPQTTTSYSNDVNVPSDALSLATLDMLGGMSRKGKNLLEIKPSTLTNNGITCTSYEDGHVHISGTNGAPYTIFFYFSAIGITSTLQNDIPINGNCTYSATFKNFSISGGNSHLRVRNKSGTNIINVQVASNTTPTILSGTEQINDSVCASISVNTNCSINGDIYPMLEYGSTPTDYEPYTPNLIDGKVDDVVVYGKNLLNPTLGTTTQSGVTCTDNGDGTYTFNGTNTSGTILYFRLATNYFYPKGTYKIVGVPQSVANDTLMGISNTGVYDTGSGAIVTFNEDVYRNTLIAIGTNQVCNNLVFKPMITKDLSATYNDFTPYKETHKPIPSSVLSLPNYGIGINNNVYNYLEYADGKVLYHERVGVLDLSTITFNYRNVGAKGGYIYSTQAIPYQIRVNAFISDNYGYYGDTSGGISDATNNLAIGQFSQHGGDRYVYVNSSTQTPPKGKLYYPLETETITDVTDLFPLNFNELEVEVNGHISFHYPNDYKVDIPNTISYLIDIKGALNG